MANESKWLLGVWHKDGSTEKSHKVKLEPKPKRWAYIPKKKVIPTPNEVTVLSGDLGNHMWWVAYYVMPDWLEQASIPERLQYRDLHALKKDMANHPMVKAWPDEAHEHGADITKAREKPKQVNLFMPDREPEF